jgi:hypothetical protein
LNDPRVVPIGYGVHDERPRYANHHLTCRGRRP